MTFRFKEAASASHRSSCLMFCQCFGLYLSKPEGARDRSCMKGRFGLLAMRVEPSHAYERWVVSSPIERLRIQPDDRPELVEGKWSRVNARACVMLLGALDEAVKADLIARKTTHRLRRKSCSGCTLSTSREGRPRGPWC